LSYNRLTISYSYPTIASYKLASPILVSLFVPKVVAYINSVVTGAFGGMLFDFINTVTVVVNV
jgi:hypothetical protein